MTRVINIRTGGAYDVYIGRAGHGFAGPFGNPFPPLKPTMKSRLRSIERFREYFLKRVDEDLDFRAAVLPLRGRTLGCFCKPLPCHGDVLAAWLDKQNG